MVASTVVMKDVDLVQKMDDVKADEMAACLDDETETTMVRHLAESKENPWVDEMAAWTVVKKDVDLVQKMVDAKADEMVAYLDDD